MLYLDMTGKKFAYLQLVCVCVCVRIICMMEGGQKQRRTAFMKIK